MIQPFAKRGKVTFELALAAGTMFRFWAVRSCASFVVFFSLAFGLPHGLHLPVGMGEAVGGETIYNFVGVTNPSSTHVARDFEVDVLDPTDPPTNDSIDTLTSTGTTTGTPNLRTGIAGYASDAEATSTQYSYIATSNNTRWLITDPGLGDNAVFWAKFKIAEDPSTISRIVVNLEGYQGVATDKAWLGIWRPEAATPYWKYLMAWMRTADYNYTGTITVDTDEYIDVNGDLHIIFFNEDDDDVLRVDYVEIRITYVEAAFSAEPTSGGWPLNVTFSDSSTPAGEIQSWAWDFNNDGTTDSTI